MSYLWLTFPRPRSKENKARSACINVGHASKFILICNCNYYNCIYYYSDHLVTFLKDNIMLKKSANGCVLKSLT